MTTTDSGARGLFLVVEGIEGAGKSTQVRLLGEGLEEAGVPHLVTREPGGTELGEAVRSVVLDRPKLDVPPESELFLVLAARAAFVRQVVRPALAEGRVVVADRYALSTFCYQGYGRQLELAAIEKANALATSGLTPDLCVVLRVPVGVGVDRQRREGKKADRLESSGDRFFERVYEGYEAMIASHESIVAIDGEGTPERVQNEIRASLRESFPETFVGLTEYHL